MPPTDSLITIQDSSDPMNRCDEFAEEDMVLAAEVWHKQALDEAWSQIIDEKLIEWPRMHRDFEIEGLIGPSNEAVATALELVKLMRERNWPLPTGVIADGDGGIAFENRRDPLYQRINIDESGTMELETYHNCQIVAQHHIDI